MLSERLFHVSDQPDIIRFAPRPARPGHPNDPGRPVVWAVGERLLHNYLLPRDCPHVTLSRLPDHHPQPQWMPGHVPLMGHVEAMLAIEGDIALALGQQITGEALVVGPIQDRCEKLAAQPLPLSLRPNAQHPQLPIE